MIDRKARHPSGSALPNHRRLNHHDWWFWGTAGQPAELIDGLIQLGIKDLTIVSNNAGNGDYGLAKLLKAGA